VVDGSYYLIHKTLCARAPPSLSHDSDPRRHALRARRHRSCPMRPSSDARRLPAAPRLRCPDLRPRAPPSCPPRPARRALDSDAPASASPPASALATARPSSSILDTKRASTPTPRPVTHLLCVVTLMPRLAPILLRALMPSAAHPPCPDADQPVSSISHY
jgi:hypothetical protein